MIKDDPVDLQRAAARYRRIAERMNDKQAVTALEDMARDYRTRAEQLIDVQRRADRAQTSDIARD